jgi:DNA (cytosine-5)-methyltransferase 1
VKPRLLDLFCKAGGCTKGYQLAGFYVVGVDIEPQPNYCGDEFFQADALEFPLEGFDAIHASPPCQAFSKGSVCRPGLAESYPDLVDPIRQRLVASGKPYVIENVPGAPLRHDLVLCGCAFGLRSGSAQLRRPRIFESNFPMFSLLPPCDHHGRSIPVYGHNPGADYYKRWGHGSPLDERKEAMQIDWMKREELSEAIPPAFTKFIGEHLMSHLKETANA